MGAIGRLGRLYSDFYIRRKVPSIVYSMERTASVSLYQSLLACGELAVATHYVEPAAMVDGRMSRTAIWAARKVLGHSRPHRVISLVRNPFDHMLSMFARASHDRAVLASAQGEASIGDLTRPFVEEFLGKREYMRQLEWFDGPYKSQLGLDVYAHPFDKARGFGRFSHDSCDALVVRTELKDAEKSAVVGEFLGRPEFRMVDVVPVKRARTEAAGMPGEKSAYGASYKALKQGVEIPREHVERIRESRYARHFFTDEELDASIRRVTGREPK